MTLTKEGEGWSSLTGKVVYASEDVAYQHMAIRNYGVVFGEVCITTQVVPYWWDHIRCILRSALYKTVVLSYVSGGRLKSEGLVLHDYCQQCGI